MYVYVALRTVRNTRKYWESCDMTAAPKRERERERESVLHPIIKEREKEKHYTSFLLRYSGLASTGNEREMP